MRTREIRQWRKEMKMTTIRKWNVNNTDCRELKLTLTSPTMTISAIRVFFGFGYIVRSIRYCIGWKNTTRVKISVFVSNSVVQLSGKNIAKIVYFLVKFDPAEFGKLQRKWSKLLAFIFRHFYSCDIRSTSLWYNVWWITSLIHDHPGLNTLPYKGNPTLIRFKSAFYKRNNRQAKGVGHR